MKKFAAMASGALILLGLAACDMIPAEYEKHWIQLKKEVDAFATVLSGGTSPLASPEASVSPSPGADGQLTSSNAKNAKANAETLQEIYRVVFNRDPKDKAEFGSLVDSLNQGASFEGIYNGFVHSSEYRRLEVAHAGASVEALKLFSQELGAIEVELATPTEFDAKASQPLPLPVQPSADALPPADGIKVIEYGKGQVTESPQPLTSAVVKPDAMQLADRYGKVFVGASIFTLKRTLGDEAQKLVAALKRDRLAAWYGRWVVRMAATGVDFGIAQRNLPDETFHSQWALTANVDRLEWEILNRLHRVLNEANKQKQ